MHDGGADLRWALVRLLSATYRRSSPPNGVDISAIFLSNYSISFAENLSSLQISTPCLTLGVEDSSTRSRWAFPFQASTVPAEKCCLLFWELCLTAWLSCSEPPLFLVTFSEENTVPRGGRDSTGKSDWREDLDSEYR